MVELRHALASRGSAALSWSIRRGEVVGLAGRPAAVARACEMIAGRRRPHAGSVSRDPDCRAVLLRADDALPAGLSTREALLFYAAAWGLEGPAAAERVDRALARSTSGVVARGLVADATLWVVASAALPHEAEAALTEIVAEARAGTAAVVWSVAATARRALCDRVIEIES